MGSETLGMGSISEGLENERPTIVIPAEKRRAIGTMGRTLDAARHYADTPEMIIEATETARAVFIENPPGADALKVLILLIDTAGPDIAEDMTHETRLRELNMRKVMDLDGVQHGLREHTRTEIRKVMTRLAVSVLHLDEPDKREEHIGVIVPHATIDYREEAQGDLTIRWKFGEVFKKLAAESDLYTKLDAAALLAMRSRYAIALLRHCSTHFGKTRRNRETFSIEYLRQVLGVHPGRLATFSNLKKWALQPAIAEINTISRWTLEATPHKTGRSVTSVTISWTEKALAEKHEAKAELDRHSAGRRQRQDGTAERIAEHPPFPDSIHSFRGGFWETVWRDAGCKADMEATRTGFIEWTERTGKPRTPQIFFNFCKGENERKGIR